MDYIDIGHRLLKLRTDGGQSRVRELGSIDFVMSVMIAVSAIAVISYNTKLMDPSSWTRA